MNDLDKKIVHLPFSLMFLRFMFEFWYQNKFVTGYWMWLSFESCMKYVPIFIFLDVWIVLNSPIHYLTIKVYFLAVVNLTLIDLPGLTKVAVGILALQLLFLFPVLIGCILCSLPLQINWLRDVLYLQKDSRRVLFKILKTWFAHILRR